MEINIGKECSDSKLLPGLATTSDFDVEQVQSWIDSLGILSK